MTVLCVARLRNEHHEANEGDEAMQVVQLPAFTQAKPKDRLLLPVALRRDAQLQQAPLTTYRQTVQCNGTNMTYDHSATARQVPTSTLLCAQSSITQMRFWVHNTLNGNDTECIRC